MSPTGLLLVNTDAIVANWQLISDRLRLSNPAGMSAAVVKANAYGLGVHAVGDALNKAGCQHFFVATLQEAVELREIVGRLPEIFVLGGLSHGCGDEWLKYGFIPVLFDVGHVGLWLAYCQRVEQRLPCVLKVDTGMHRLGLDPHDLNGLLEKSQGLDSLNLRYLMSHLACADEAAHPLNQQQLSAFSSCVSKIKAVFPDVICSFANSSGVFLGSNFHFDLARPGSALYGVNPVPLESNPMRSVVKLVLPVMQVRTISKAESVGYGASFHVQRESRIAVVFGGYADGLLRGLSNRGFGYCRGQRVPIVGRVSMDSLALDITDLDFLPDTVELLNDVQGVDALAASARTIGYEILTSLGARYKRHYVSTFEGV
ncbi:MAG: alanine racemase [Cellvibrionaceae bacterium]